MLAFSAGFSHSLDHKRPSGDFNKVPFSSHSLELKPRVAQSLNAALKYLRSSVGQHPPPPFQ